MAKVKFVFIGIDEMTEKMVIRAVPASVVANSGKFEAWCEKEEISCHNSVLLSTCQVDELIEQLQAIYLHG